MKKIIIIVVVLLILGGGGAYYFFVMRAPAEPDVEQVISKKVAIAQPTDGQTTPAATPATPTATPAATTTAPTATPAPAAASTTTAKPATPAPTPAVAAKPAPAVAVSAKAAFKPYIVNVASFTKKAEAENLSKELSGGGYAVYQMDFEKGGVTYYRVRVGFYASTDEAKAAGKDIVKKFPKADSPWPQKIEKPEYDKYYNK